MKTMMIGAVAAMLAAPASGWAQSTVTTLAANVIPAYDYQLLIPVNKELRIVETESTGVATLTVNGGPGSYTQSSVTNNPDGSVTTNAVAVATPPAP